MFLSRIELRRRQPGDTAQADAFWSQSRSAYDLHQAVWTWFGDRQDRTRDFLYRIESSDPRGGLRIYTLSARSPSVDGRLWRLNIKSYEPQLTAKTPLAFLLRANPTITRTDSNGRSQRHDVIMDARTQLTAAGKPLPPRPVLVQEAGTAWLERRAESLGFSLDPSAVRVDGYQPVRFRRRGRPITFSQADFQGRLTVTDPERFHRTLMQGVGRSKAFGCGLMMIRRL